MTGITETGAIVVPWQAKDIIAMAPIKPPKPPEKNIPSSLEKYPGCTLGSPTATKRTIDTSRTTVITVVRFANAFVPLIDKAKKATISKIAIQTW